MILDVCTYGNPVLREKSRKVTEVDDHIRALAENMIETMHQSSGVGLAAQQVGHTESICVIDVPQEALEDDDGSADVAYPFILLNPEITAVSAKTTGMEEGCLSFPRIYASVNRPVFIELTYTDLEGHSKALKTGGFLARVIQHEVDHLSGVVFVDRISHVKKIALSGRIKKLIRQTKDKLHPSM
ncbi:MAG: peptide deformylase [Spartobacteria bacterium]|nr:peptide deformylase [Spartobacteria bacterium]